MPKRIQMSRQRPWRAEHPDAVIVARPHPWSNPFVVGTPENGGNITRELAVSEYKRALLEGRLSKKPRHLVELQGFDLACWCPLGEPCHADVLLELANPASPNEGTNE